MNGLCYEKQPIALWVASHAGVLAPWENFEAIGYKEDGRLIAGAVFTDYTGSNVTLNLVANRGWQKTGFADAMANYAFGQLGVRRVTAHVAAKRKSLIRFYRWQGFQVEGVMRDALPDDDWVIMGLLAKDCRYGGFKDENAIGACAA